MRSGIASPRPPSFRSELKSLAASDARTRADHRCRHGGVDRECVWFSQPIERHVLIQRGVNTGKRCQLLGYGFDWTSEVQSALNDSLREGTQRRATTTRDPDAVEAAARDGARRWEQVSQVRCRFGDGLARERHEAAEDRPSARLRRVTGHDRRHGAFERIPHAHYAYAGSASHERSQHLVRLECVDDRRRVGRQIEHAARRR